MTNSKLSASPSIDADLTVVISGRELRSKIHFFSRKGEFPIIEIRQLRGKFDSFLRSTKSASNNRSISRPRLPSKEKRESVTPRSVTSPQREPRPAKKYPIRFRESGSSLSWEEKGTNNHPNEESATVTRGGSIPFLPDARNLQPRIFFEGIEGGGEAKKVTRCASAPFSTSLVSSFFSLPFRKRYDLNQFSDSWRRRGAR